METINQKLIMVDSLKNKINAMVAEIDHEYPFALETDEGIIDYQWVTDVELNQLIADNQITDNFTLATLMKFYAQQRK